MTNATNAPHAALTKQEFAAVVGIEGGRRVVRVFGDLDLDGCEALIRTCAGGEPMLDVVVDLSELTFMDCAGYGAVVQARAAVIEHGCTLTLANGAGEPARLLALIGQLERDAGQRNDQKVVN